VTSRAAVGATRLRRRTDADLGSCLELLRVTFETDAYPPFGWPDDPLRFLSPDAERAAWVVEIDGDVVGHVALHDAEGDVASTALADRDASSLAVVARLMVAPRARRRGVATALLDRAADAARAAGSEPILDVGTRLTAAVRLYSRLGWVPCGTVEAPSPAGPITAQVFRAPPPRISQTAVVVAAPDGRVEMWSPGATALFGYDANAVVGRNLDVLIPDDLRHRHWAGWRRAWRDGAIPTLSPSIIPVRCSDGIVRTFAGKLAGITDPHGALVAAIATWTQPDVRDDDLPNL
jgi:PAS domain S-box-containing protein